MSRPAVTTLPIPSVKLNSGHSMPLIQFGCYGGSDDASTISSAVKAALYAGYTGFDSASAYLNEAEIGATVSEFMKENDVPRSRLWITSKLYQTHHATEHVRPAVMKSISDLQCGYLDLLLMHWPIAWKYTGPQSGDIPRDANGRIQYEAIPIIETWRAMEKLVEEGLVRSIGVSNFPVILLHDLLTQAKIPPAVNQVEVHPYLSQEALVEYCMSRGVHVTAYSPLGRPGRAKIDVPVMKAPEAVTLAHQLSQDVMTAKKAAQAAEAHPKLHDNTDDIFSPATVLLAWNVMRGVSVLPKSSTPARLQHNLHATLDLLHHFQHDADKPHRPGQVEVNVSKDNFMKTINSLNRNLRYVNHPMAGEFEGQFVPRGPTLFE